MTSFAQHPDAATASVPQFIVQDSHTQQYVPAPYRQHQTVNRQQQLAPNMAPYPSQSQQYQQAGHAQQADQQPVRYAPDRNVVYPPNEPTAGEAHFGAQLRPSLDQRHSNASFRSARSHRSTRSADSHRSHHSTKSHKSTRSYHSHHSAIDKPRSHRKKRDLDARPTMGDSVMLVVNHFRDMLSGDRR